MINFEYIQQISLLNIRTSMIEIIYFVVNY